MMFFFVILTIAIITSLVCFYIGLFDSPHPMAGWIALFFSVTGGIACYKQKKQFNTNKD